MTILRQTPNAILHRHLASPKHIVLSVGWVFLAHVILMTGLVLANYTKIIPPLAYYAAFILWATVPAFVMRSEKVNT